jgi:hypothetical protein
LVPSGYLCRHIRQGRVGSFHLFFILVRISLLPWGGLKDLLQPLPPSNWFEFFCPVSPWKGKSVSSSSSFVLYKAQLFLLRLPSCISRLFPFPPQVLQFLHKIRFTPFTTSIHASIHPYLSPPRPQKCRVEAFLKSTSDISTAASRTSFRSFSFPMGFQPRKVTSIETDQSSHHRRRPSF